MGKTEEEEAGRCRRGLECELVYGTMNSCSEAARQLRVLLALRGFGSQEWCVGELRDWEEIVAMIAGVTKEDGAVLVQWENFTCAPVVSPACN